MLVTENFKSPETKPAKLKPAPRPAILIAGRALDSLVHIEVNPRPEEDHCNKLATCKPFLGSRKMGGRKAYQ